MKLLPLACALLACTAVPASGAVLYKSVGSDGVVSFSDQPPPDKAKGVERIVMPDSSSPSATGNPIIASGPTREETMRAADEAIQRANMQVDMAEHALAQARRTIWGESTGLFQVKENRRTRADNERLDFYKKNVVIARAQLMDVLREKRKQEAKATMTASNTISSTEWTPLR